MKTLAIIGASYLQQPLVEKAKAMGLRTLCFAWEEGAVCKNICDKFFPISILEKEKILEVCRREEIDGVTSIASDSAVPTVAYVAHALGLIGNTERSAYLSTNKYAMRKALADSGVRCPKFTKVASVEEAAVAVERIGYPVIVKPCDRSGSMGVAKVDNLEALAVAVETAVSDSFCKMAVVEECITDMHEVSVEGISWKGEYHLLQITDKVTTGAPHYVELGHHQPARLPDALRAKVVDEVRKGIKAQGIINGASHAELMITAEGEVYVTEIGARMGGDFIGSDLVPISTGYDFLRGVIEIALGEFSGVTFGKRHCSGVWFYSPDTLEVGDIIRQKDKWPQIVRSELHEDALKTLTRSADRAGYFIYQGNERHLLMTASAEGKS